MVIHLIHIGNELLNGIRINRHLTYLGKQFHKRNLSISQASVIPDTQSAIRFAFMEATQKADLIIATGGLGPTVDDCTKEVVATLLGLPLHDHLPTKDKLSRFIKEKKISYGLAFSRQQKVPQGAEVLENLVGTAPGLKICLGKKIIILLPGPPRELIPMFENQVIPHLEKASLLPRGGESILFQTAFVAESLLQNLLFDILKEHQEHLAIALCAHNGGVSVQLTDTNKRYGKTKLDLIGLEVQRALGKDFVAYGETSIAEEVIKQLTKLGHTIATAESCTGGLISSLLTDVAGASKVFLGSSVLYSNQSKSLEKVVPEKLIAEQGVVSEAVARAMVIGIAKKYKSDYAISTTGYLDSNSGDYQIPSGTVFIGIKSPTKITILKTEKKGSRAYLKERTALLALDQVRRLL